MRLGGVGCMRKVMINYNRGLEHYIENYAKSIERERTIKRVNMINSLGKRGIHNAHAIGYDIPFTAGISELGMKQSISVKGARGVSEQIDLFPHDGTIHLRRQHPIFFIAGSNLFNLFNIMVK
jgi:hypothetical protein